ncbi:MAG: hypothetical protein U5R06_17615 [candidate division KSB1 bacterium]|nr:hypothetical protein [candidate division KSB1 bacterium]
MTTHRFLIILVFLTVGLLANRCENPLKDEQKKEQVIELIDEYFVEPGQYIFFWDGRDKTGNYIEPGKYIVLLEIKNWQDQETLTAEKGGKHGKNDNAHYEPGYWLYDDLLEPEPNPFQIMSGVNIPVRLSEPTRIILRIYKD